MHSLRLLWAAHNEEVWLRRQKRNISRHCLEQISEMPDLVFLESFRLDKQTFRKLCRELRASSLLRGTKEIPLEVKFLCTLSFLASGSYQRIIGFTQHMPQRTASRCIRQVVEALNSTNLMDKYITFPKTLQERSELRQQFQRKYNLPGVLGCIDCTNITIVRPGRDDHLYFDGKGYNLNVQMICDHNLKILSVNPKYGGATHNSEIWSSSQAEPYLRQLHENGEQTWLLGDSEYPQCPWLMIPVLNAPPGSEEEEYTLRHIPARDCIEHCFVLLKSRWRCLHQTLHYKPFVASKIVLACCVLHNIALNAGLPPPTDVGDQFNASEHYNGGDDNFGEHSDSSLHDLMHGRAMLSSLINML